MVPIAVAAKDNRSLQADGIDRWLMHWLVVTVQVGSLSALEHHEQILPDQQTHG